jgi:hypothetical protein
MSSQQCRSRSSRDLVIPQRLAGQDRGSWFHRRLKESPRFRVSDWARDDHHEQGGYVPRYASAPPMMEATAKAVPIEPGTEKLDIEFTNQYQFHFGRGCGTNWDGRSFARGSPSWTSERAPATSAGASLSPPATPRAHAPARAPVLARAIYFEVFSRPTTQPEKVIGSASCCLPATQCSTAVYSVPRFCRRRR